MLLGKGLIHDRPDGGRASATLGAAAKAAIDLGRSVRTAWARVEAGTHLAIREDIARADDHEDLPFIFASASIGSLQGSTVRRSDLTIGITYQGRATATLRSVKSGASHRC